MVRKIVTAFLFLILFFSVASFNSIFAQKINIDNQQIAYDLPYPGLLPDHPLYFLKAARDRIQDFITVDKLNNAELYLLYSDKRANAARSLAEKGRNDMAITTISKAEKYALKIPELLEKVDKTKRKELLEKTKLSNRKHKEIIEEFMKQLPEGDQERLTEILGINESVGKNLNSLK